MYSSGAGFSTILMPSLLLAPEPLPGYKETIMKKPVDEFDAILLASLELETAMEKANMSMLKLLQEELEHNPNPVGIDAFLRMAKTIRRAWSVLLRRGKAPTRKAHGGLEKQQLLASARKKTLRVRKNRRKN
jgi:hypothetical protein